MTTTTSTINFYRQGEINTLKDEIAKLRADNKALRDALKKIERWFGEFPDTGRKWDDGSPMSYSAAFGSNGERDFMRGIARAAIEHSEPQ